MSVAEQTARNQYTASGSNATFAYTFKVLTKNGLRVFQDGTEKTVDTDYSVTGVGAANGGNVVFGSNPAANVIITIIGSQDIEQDSQYAANEDFPHGRLEQDLDIRAMVERMVQEEVARCLKLPIHTQSLNTTLPLLTSGVNKFLGVNGTGDGFVLATPGSVVNDTYNPPFTGGIARTATAKFAETVSIQDFEGSDSSGATASDAAWNRMIAYAASTLAASNGRDGVRCVVPRGSWKMADTFNYGTLPRGIIVDCESAWGVRFKPAFSGAPLFLIQDGYRCELNNCMIEDPSSGAATVGVKILRTNATVGAGTSQFRMSRVLIGLVGAGTIERAVQYAFTGTDAQNELGFFDYCDFRSTVAGVSITGLNSLLHEFIGCLITSPIGFEIAGGSIRQYGGGMNCSDVDYDITATSDGQYSSAHPVVNAIGVYHESSGKLIRQTSALGATFPSFKFTNCEGEGATASTSFIDIRATNADVELNACRWSTGQSNVRLKVTGTSAELRANGGEFGFDELEVNNIASFHGTKFLSGVVTETLGGSAKVAYLGTTANAASAGLIHWLKRAQMSVLNFLTDDLTSAGRVICNRVRFVREALTSWPGLPAVGDSAFVFVNDTGLNVADNSGTARLFLSLADGILNVVAGSISGALKFIGVNGAETRRLQAQATVNSSAAATLTAANLIPAGACNVMVTARVLTAFGTSTGLTSFQIGDGTDADRWGAAAPITLNATYATFTVATMPCYAAATNVVLTANGGNFDATGQVRLTVHYDLATAPTS